MSKLKVIKRETTFIVNDMTLSDAVRHIQGRSERLKFPVTEEAMAEKMGISLHQFNSYLTDEKSYPEDFVSHLLSAYGLKFVTGVQTATIEPPAPLKIDGENTEEK